MEFSTKIMDAVAEILRQAVIETVAQQPDSQIADLEQWLRQLLQQAGAQALASGLTALEKQYPEAQVACPCGQLADYQFRRKAKTLTVFGWVAYRRAYYVCASCHCGQSPLDQRFGLEPGKVSAGLAPLLALAGVETAFEEACQLVQQFLLLEVSDNTLRKETQTFGQLQAREEQLWHGQSEDPQALQQRQHHPPAHPRRLYGAMDGSHVPIGPEWRELKTGCWFEVEKVRPASGGGIGQLDELRAKNIHYYCDLSEAQEFGKLLWATGVQHGADLAEELIFLGDGAAWIWNLVERHFPHAVQIVDWYHAVEYLPPIAEAAFGSGSARAKAWLERVTKALWEGCVPEVIAICQTLAHHPQAGESARRALTYFGNNHRRMDYARFRAAGYQMGSGTVESGCKQICTQRLKRAGARWTFQGARMTAKARAAWLSGSWDRLSTMRADLPLAI